MSKQDEDLYLGSTYTRAQLEKLAIDSLAELAQYAESESVRKHAAAEILDRVQGKAMQKTHNVSDVNYNIICNIPAPPNSIKELEAIDVEPKVVKDSWGSKSKEQKMRELEDAIPFN